MGRVTPPHANSALLGRYGHGPRAASSRDRVKEDVGLEEAFRIGCRAVVGDLDEHCGS